MMTEQRGRGDNDGGEADDEEGVAGNKQRSIRRRMARVEC
jgi:hypothetical protein